MRAVSSRRSLFGLLALAAAIYWSITRGGGRVGWVPRRPRSSAWVSGSPTSRRRVVDNLDVVFRGRRSSDRCSATRRRSLRSLGGLFSERSGVVNIGLEGMMLMGAFFGHLGADKTGSWALGIVDRHGRRGGARGSSTRSSPSICAPTRSSAAPAINFLALGITGYAFVDIYGDQGIPPASPPIASPSLDLGFLDRDRPGQSATSCRRLRRLNLMIWVGFVVVILAYVVIFRTPLGLRMRAVGEHPRAADTVGIAVYGIRYGAVITLRRARRARRGVPVGRGSSTLRPEPHGRPGLHRARGDDLRQLAAFRRVRRMPSVRLLERARATGCRRTSTPAADTAPLQRAARTCSPSSPSRA